MNVHFKPVQNIHKFIHAYDHRYTTYFRDATLCKQKINTILTYQVHISNSQPPELFVVPLSRCHPLCVCRGKVPYLPK